MRVRHKLVLSMTALVIFIYLFFGVLEYTNSKDVNHFNQPVNSEAKE